MSATERQPLPNSTGLVSDVLRERTAHQSAQLDGLDSKASTALGFAGVLLGLLFANSSCYKMRTMADDETPQPEPKPEVEPVELQEPEIQQEIADDQTWMQKGLTDDDYETR